MFESTFADLQSRFADAVEIQDQYPICVRSLFFERVIVSLYAYDNFLQLYRRSGRALSAAAV